MNNNFIDNHSSEFDIDLNNAMRNGLCWLPWIGKYYNEQAIKILVVGESHYASNKNRTEIQKDCDVDRVADDKDFTRAVIYESRIMRWWSNTTYDNVRLSMSTLVVGRLNSAFNRNALKNFSRSNFFRPTPHHFISDVIKRFGRTISTVLRKFASFPVIFTPNSPSNS